MQHCNTLDDYVLYNMLYDRIGAVCDLPAEHAFLFEACRRSGVLKVVEITISFITQFTHANEKNNARV